MLGSEVWLSMPEPSHVSISVLFQRQEPKRFIGSLRGYVPLKKRLKKPPDLLGSVLPKCTHSLRTQDQGGWTPLCWCAWAFPDRAVSPRSPFLPLFLPLPCFSHVLVSGSMPLSTSALMKPTALHRMIMFYACQCKYLPYSPTLLLQTFEQCICAGPM